MGTLYIVSTPIGNLKDISLRALEILKSADYVLCEDTRVTGRLLANFGIRAKMVTFGDFNEEQRVDSVIEDLRRGLNIAIVSDAGTPLISDPGYKIVRRAIGEQVKVEAVGVTSALIYALVVSGKPPDKFLYMGFLPKSPNQIRNLLLKLIEFRRQVKFTVILYESPYRILRTLDVLGQVLPNEEIVVARELSKMNQEIKRGSAFFLKSYFEKRGVKGEITILI